MGRRLPLFLAQMGEFDSSDIKKKKNQRQEIRDTIKRPVVQTVTLLPAAASSRKKNRLSLLFIVTRQNQTALLPQQHACCRLQALQVGSREGVCLCDRQQR